MHASRCLAAGQHFGHIRRITLRRVLLVFLLEAARVLAGVARAASWFFGLGIAHRARDYLPVARLPIFRLRSSMFRRFLPVAFLVPMLSAAHALTTLPEPAALPAQA